MALTLEMPATDLGHDFTPGPASDVGGDATDSPVDAATEAADILEQADADGGIDEGADYSEPLGDIPFDTNEPASPVDAADGLPADAVVETAEADPPSEPPKKKRGRKRKGDKPAGSSVQPGQPSESSSPLVKAIVEGKGIVEAIAASPGPTPAAVDAVTAGSAPAEVTVTTHVISKPPITRAERIAELTTDLVEVVIECQKTESIIARNKTRLKELEEQRAELSDELCSVRDNEQWQPPLLKLPKQDKSESAGTEGTVSPSSVDPGQNSDAPPTAALNNDNTWRTGKIDELGLTEKMADKLKSFAGGDTIGHLEDYRVRIANRTDKWPPRIGPEAVTKIENAIADWLGKHRDAAVLAAASGKNPASQTDAAATPPAEAPATETPPVSATPVPSIDAHQIPTFDQWESMTDEQQQEYICARAVILEDGTENSLATKHPNGSTFWDSGYEAFGRGMKVSECTFVPGPEGDDWIRGWLAHGAVEKFEPDEKPAAAGAAEVVKTKPWTPLLSSLDDL